MSQAAIGRSERRGRVGKGRGLIAGEGLEGNEGVETGEGRALVGGEVGAMVRRRDGFRQASALWRVQTRSPRSA